jgi:hypothetical protein
MAELGKGLAGGRRGGRGGSQFRLSPCSKPAEFRDENRAGRWLAIVQTISIYLSMECLCLPLSGLLPLHSPDRARHVYVWVLFCSSDNAASMGRRRASMCNGRLGVDGRRPGRRGRRGKEVRESSEGRGAPTPRDGRRRMSGQRRRPSSETDRPAVQRGGEGRGNLDCLVSSNRYNKVYITAVPPPPLWSLVR